MANDASAISTDALATDAPAIDASTIDASTTSEIIELLLDRRSVRTIAPDPIRHEQIETVLARHYRGTGRQTPDDSWSHDMDKKFHPYLRDSLRDALRELGFDFR